MVTTSSSSNFQTHEILNQTPPLTNYDFFSTDLALRDALNREGGGWSAATAAEFGVILSSEVVTRWGFQANENGPRLRAYDRFGVRVDEIEFHPAWHELMRLSVSYGLHCQPWLHACPGAHVARAAQMMLASQNELGHLCPVSMTYSAVAVLRNDPTASREWLPRILSNKYDERFQPAHKKNGCLVGMAMTEKQGGSDVRANTTTAEPAGCGEYALTGHKWFCSAPMCDAFLVLAQAARGLSCFLLPRWTADGRRNAFHIQRLKDKLGNRSNASSEVEFDRASARLIGEEGRGVATIINMVRHTRLDCVIASTGLMRQAVVQALHHSSHRRAFGGRLIEQPLMRNVLADLCVESEAATVLMMRLARSFEPEECGGDRGFARLATATAKYWVCKRAVTHVAEALECLGGNGYVEESILPRLYRETPLNSLWEGSANVICLDVLRALAKEPESLESVRAEIKLSSGLDRRLDKYIARLDHNLVLIGGAGASRRSKSMTDLEIQARQLTGQLAIALQGSLLVRHSIPAVAEAFISSRVNGDLTVFGTLKAGVDFRSILERAWPTELVYPEGQSARAS